MSFLLVTGVTDGVTESEGDWGFLPRKPTMDSGGKGARRVKSTVGLDISRTNRKVPIRSHLLQFPLSRSSSNHHSHPFPPMKCQDSDGLFPETHPLWVNSETSPRAKLLATGNHRYTSSGRLRDSICFPRPRWSGSPGGWGMISLTPSTIIICYYYSIVIIIIIALQAPYQPFLACFFQQRAVGLPIPWHPRTLPYK